MGLYDERCAISGVSLKGSKAALVLLGRTGAAWHPIALPIWGTYNRLGAIDMIEDENAHLVHAYFRARWEAGDLVLAEEHAESVDDLEALLGAFERNVTQGEDAALLFGRRVLFALIDRHVWGAAAKAGKADKASNSERFRRVFEGVPVAEAIYRGAVGKVSKPLTELDHVCAFLDERGLAWRVRTEGGAQHYEEVRDFLAEARRNFADCPAMLKGLDAYEKDIQELLEDEED